MNHKTTNNAPIAGYAAMVATVVVWAAYALSLRATGDASLTIADVGLIRFGVPALLLAPLLPRTLRALRHERPWVIAAMCCAGGLPFFLVAAMGGHLTSASMISLIVAGTVPVFVTAFDRLQTGRTVSARRRGALAAILTGVTVAAAAAASPSHAVGVLVLLGGGLMWTVFTLALQRIGLSPASASLTVCLPSTALALALPLTGAASSHLLAGSAATGDAVTFLVVQGIGAGVLSTITYRIGVRALGSSAASAIGALTPVVTAVAAIPLLGEAITASAVVSGALIIAGVMAFSRASARAEISRPRTGRFTRLSLRASHVPDHAAAAPNATDR
jgi:drug/metabolite transporter (DMT)-like permease